MRNSITFVLALFLCAGTCGAQSLFSMEQYGEADLDTAEWHLNFFGDTIALAATYFFTIDDVVALTNGSSFPIDFGLSIEGIYDEMGYALPWEARYNPSNDGYVLLGIFQDDRITPTTFNSISDNIQTEIRWANASFGPAGFNIPPDSSDYLFLIFKSPYSSSICGHFIIDLKIFAGMADSYTIMGEERNILIYGYLPCDEIELEHGIPTYSSLIAFPNPFNSSCEISVVGAYGIRPKETRIEIFDLNGKCVLLSEELIVKSEELPSTTSQVGGVSGTLFTLHSSFLTFVWTPNNSISSGIYLLRSTIGEQTITKRIVYLK